jgi:hypothetical protein
VSGWQTLAVWAHSQPGLVLDNATNGLRTLGLGGWTDGGSNRSPVRCPRYYRIFERDAV